MPTALVTGANRGIGLEFVRQYAADGWRVDACCREPGKADELKSLRGDIAVHALDVTERAAIAALAEQIGEPLDLVIANAGVGGWDIPEFGALDYDAWARVMEVNLFGAVATCEAFAPHVVRAKGKIAAISSRMGSIADAGAGSIPYRTSKAALNMAVKLIAAELAPKGVAVAPFHPGWVKTELGGPNARISARESVSGLRRCIDRMKPTAAPSLVDYTGKKLPW